MTPEQIKNFILVLEQALADNVLTVEFEGKKTNFDNADGIIKRINYFKGQLRVADGRSSRGPRRVTVVTIGSKGL